MMTHEERKRLRETDAFDPNNVRDEFKGMSVSEIRKALNNTRMPFVAICSNVVKDMNIGQIVRAVNGYGCMETMICGFKSWDKRGAVGTYHYENITKFDTVRDAVDILKTISPDYRIVGAEITENSVPLTTYKWNTRTAVVFGEEGCGLPQNVLDLCDDVVHIPMHGSVRSFNVAGAAQVFMYDYMSKERR